MSEVLKNKFIGTGITFPLEIDGGTSEPIVSSDLKLIRSSIGVILNWPENIRFFNERFGCRIEELLEEPDEAVSRTLAKQFIRDALEKWEKRIIIKEVKALDSTIAGRIDLQIHYEIRNTKIGETVIYPFYTELKY